MTLPLAPQRTERTEQKSKLTLPGSLYTVFLLLLNLAALSLAFFDAKGIVVLILSMMYTVHVRLQLTQRAEQRRTNDLLEEWLELQVEQR